MSKLKIACHVVSRRVMRRFFSFLLRGLVIAGLCFVALAGYSAFAQRAIPPDNLAYPVLIEIPVDSGVESGSGFYINTAKSVYLVTAEHVLFNPDTKKLRGPQMTLLSYPRDPNDEGLNLVSVNLATLSSRGDVIPSATEDVAVVRIESFTSATTMETQPKNATGTTGPRPLPPAMTIPGVTVLKLASSGAVVTSVGIVKKYADVLVGNEVIVYGYPTSIGLKQIPQLDPNRPLLRKGIVAGLNPATQTIVIDCPVYPGNSGGPVIELDRTPFRTDFKLIGVVTQFVPFAKGSSNFYSLDNSGYALVAPMDGVLALIK